VKEEKYKCFLEGKWRKRKIIIVPSFAEHREGSDPRDFSLNLAWDFDVERFRVWIIGGQEEVLDFGVLGKLKR
jgi:metallophosphoesterase superfamily enzyme